jgi:hypothetical protein
MANPTDIMAEHELLIGSVVVAYNRVQRLINILFIAFSGMPEQQAQDVFFAIKSDRTQREVALAAGKTALASHAELWDRFDALVAEVNDLSGERNALVHTMWEIEWQYWGLPSLHFATKVQVAPGTIPHGRLKADFEAQCAELNKKLYKLLGDLDNLHSDYKKLAAK